MNIGINMFISVFLCRVLAIEYPLPLKKRNYYDICWLVKSKVNSSFYPTICQLDEVLKENIKFRV